MSKVTAVFIPGLLCTEWLFHGRVGAAAGQAVFANTRQHSTITAMAKTALAQTPGQLAPIGLSMGGYVALEMARLEPLRIAAMALFSTNCREDNPSQRADRQKTIELAEQEGFQGLTRKFLSKCLSPPALTDTVLVEGVLAMAADIGRSTFVKQQKAILGRRDQRDTLKSFFAPLLIVCGSADMLTPPHLSEEMAAFAPHADLRLLPNIGHLTTLEAPFECSAAVNDLISSVKAND